MGWKNLVFVALVLAWGIAVHAALDVLTVYDGEASLPACLTFGGWGMTLDHIAPVPVNGAYGLPISVAAHSQGTRIDFTPAVDTHYFLGPLDAYLELYIRANTADAAPATTAPMPRLINLHITFVTQIGMGTLTIPAAQFAPLTTVKGMWVRLVVPLSQLSRELDLGGAMSRLILSSDEPATFLLGRMAFVRDAESARPVITTFPALLQTEKPIVFASGADGSATPWKTFWDFDTAAGPSDDAVGDCVTHSYTTPGTYIITCTVRDIFGVKTPMSATRTITVSSAER